MKMKNLPDGLKALLLSLFVFLFTFFIETYKEKREAINQTMSISWVCKDGKEASETLIKAGCEWKGLEK